MKAVRNIFITGRPGIGKTTVLRKTLDLIETKVYGFTTEEIRRGRTRVGFRIDDLAGYGEVMAHVDFPGPVRVGKYGVDVGAVERVAVGALRAAVRHGTAAIVDEVGKMELACEAFVAALMEAVAAPIPVLGTMHSRQDPVTRRIREREDTRVIEITAANRNELPLRLAAMLAEASPRP